MPRVRRKGHAKRDAEAPLCEWTLQELRAEFERLETDPGELNPWQAIKRRGELLREIDAREQCPA